MYLLEIYKKGFTGGPEQIYFEEVPSREQIHAIMLKMAIELLSPFVIKQIVPSSYFNHKISFYTSDNLLSLEYVVTSIKTENLTLKEFLTHENPVVRKFAKEGL